MSGASGANSTFVGDINSQVQYHIVYLTRRDSNHRPLGHQIAGGDSGERSTTKIRVLGGAGCLLFDASFMIVNLLFCLAVPITGYRHDYHRYDYEHFND